MSKRPSSDPTAQSSKRPTSGEPTPMSGSRRNSSGGSAGHSAGSRSNTASTDICMPVPHLARGGTGSGERNRAAAAPLRAHPSRQKKQHIMGDEKIDEPSGDLDMEIDMNDWKLIGFPGTYAEGVYEGQLRSNREEVAVKVVSLRNPSIRESKWVQEELQKLSHSLKGEITEHHVLKLCEKKVLHEMLMTQTLSNKHISFFVNYYKQSTSYTAKVLDDTSHDIHKYWALQAPQYRDVDRPHKDDSVFFVMEKMSGADLFDYNVSHHFGCGVMLAFEATPQATDELVCDALGRFPAFLEESDTKKEKESRSWRDFMYVDNTPQFFHTQGRARFLVLKFNTQFRRLLPKYQKDQHRYGSIFSEDMRLHLTQENLICNCHPLLHNGKPTYHTQRLPLFFDKTFIRTLLSQIMIALNHAHGTPVYHDDLKSDNVMFKTLVHAHSTHESKICAKVIDWGCGGFSKDSPADSCHEYKPQNEQKSEKCDIFCVGNIIRFLYDGQSSVDWHHPDGFNGMFNPKLNQLKWPCPWNMSSAHKEIESSLCVPWNPNADTGFKQLIQRMTDPNPNTRFSGRDVLQHSWMRVSEKQETDPNSEPNPHVKKLNDLLYDFAPSYLKKLGEAHDGGQTEETRFLDFMKGAGLVNLRRSLDVLVMIPMLEQLPYARSFISSNLIALLSKLVAKYMYIDTYPQRHLPRTMVLLSQLASHQSNEFLKPIFAAKYMDMEHLHDGEGRSLLELIAYGVFDCHDPDPNHKACSLYTLLMLIAMSSPDKDDLDPLSYKTQDVVRFLRNKKNKQPYPLKAIFEELVSLLEALTRSPKEAQEKRHEHLSGFLSKKSGPMKTLFEVLTKAQSDPSEAAAMLGEDQEDYCLVMKALVDFKHALCPVEKDPHFSRFVDKFLTLPDPGSRLLKLHKLLKYSDHDDMDHLRSNNGIEKSSTHAVLSRLVQALFNLSIIGHDTDRIGHTTLVESGPHKKSFLYRIMHCMQNVHRLYPKAFRKKKLVPSQTPFTTLHDFLVKLWMYTDDRARSSISEHLSMNFYRMLEELEDVPERGAIDSQ